MLPENQERQLNSLYEDWTRFEVDGRLVSCSDRLRARWRETGLLGKASHARDFFKLSADDSSVFFNAWIGAVKGFSSCIGLRLAGFESGPRNIVFTPQFDAGGTVCAIVLGVLRHFESQMAPDGKSEEGESSESLAKLVEMRDLFREITRANEELERALISAREEIEVSKLESTAKSEFLANMSHEIRTPMNAVIGFCDLLSNTELGDEQQEYVDAINHSGQLLIKLIGQVLDYSKIESGHLALDSEEFSLEQILLEVQAIMGVRLRGREIEFETELSDLSGDTVLGDPTRVKQVIINLLSNAIKFTRRGSIRLTAKTSASPNEGYLCFKVKVEDTGIGIESEQLKTLFCPFSQAHNRINREFGGTGLGLAICKRLCEAMLGDIWVERTAVGRGSVFVFKLHLQKKNTEVLALGRGEVGTGEVSAAKEVAPRVESVARPERSSPIRLLVVDDNPNNLLITSKLSRHLGYEAETVTNGVEALKRMKSSEFDIVLMDIRMAPINGIETTRLIRKGEAGERCSEAYIIAVTAHALQGDREKCLQSGMNDYLSKPLTLERLEESLKRARSELSLD